MENGSETRKEAGYLTMKKKILQRSAALAVMVFLLCVSVFGAAQETAPSENGGTEATDSIDGIVTEEAVEEVDLDKLVDENAAVTIASEEKNQSGQNDSKESQDKKEEQKKEEQDSKEEQKKK